MPAYSICDVVSCSDRGVFDRGSCKLSPEPDLIQDEPHPRGRLAVLVPAHNELVGLRPTLADLKRQLRSDDRLLVVADNCDDDTATVATSLGAEVTVRTDPTKIGKGYALDWGLNHLAKDAPDLVIIVDADCRVTKVGNRTTGNGL